MDIKNSRSLNANTYDFISIGKNINVIQTKNTWGITTICDNLIYNPVGRKFTSSLKGLNEEEKINEIIRYFLRSNIICSVSTEGYNGEVYTVIKGLEDRSLRISKMHKLSEDILKEIYQKYNLDRGKIIESSSKQNYIFGCADWCSTEILHPGDFFFMIPLLMHDEECIDITFKLDENNDISDSDKILFNQMMDEITTDVSYISDCYLDYYIIRKKDDSISQLYLCNGCSEYMRELVNEYVKNIKNKNREKSLQKKMEGF